jgi:hypothetical protein
MSELVGTCVSTKTREISADGPKLLTQSSTRSISGFQAVGDVGSLTGAGSQ